MLNEEKYLEICEKLKKIIADTGELLEGNCMYQHQTFTPWECLLNKRINYQKAVSGKKQVCEIGFNAGHSFLTMALANSDAHYFLFDLGTHKYSRLCFEYLKQCLPQVKFEIYWGDSRLTLPEFQKEHPDLKFDLAHIDGSHKSEVYKVDWENTLKVTSKDSIIIFDDTDNEKINSFINEQIKIGTVKQVNTFLQTFGYEHRILIRP